MNQYYNATDGPLELPTPNQQGTRIIGVGESFFGQNFYDRYVLSGHLARTNWGGSLHKEFIGIADFTSADESVSTPSRYKTDDATTPGANSSAGKVKFTLHYSSSAIAQDPVHITYYFYTDHNNATTATHIISITGVLENDWRFPSWADLPEDFYDLSPIAQKEALLTKR